MFGSASALYQLVTSTGPFQPALTATPNDWTVAVNFATGPTSTADITTFTPLAIDAGGDAWFATSNALYELGPNGALLGTYAAMSGSAVTIDPAGNIWTVASTSSTQPLRRLSANLSATTAYATPVASTSVYLNSLAADGNGNIFYSATSTGVYKSDSTGTTSSTTPLPSLPHTAGMAVDASERLWSGSDDTSSVEVLTNAGSAVPGSPFSIGSSTESYAIAMDSGGNAWVTGNGVAKVTSAGAYTSFGGSSGSPGGLQTYSKVAVDGGGNAWFSNSTGLSNQTAGSITELTNAGVAVSPTIGYVSSLLASPNGLGIDGSGNVWAGSQTGKVVTVFVGAAVPTVTPLALGVKNGTLGTKP